MDWKQIGINLLVMAGVYAFFYTSSYFFSKKYAEKSRAEKKNEKQK